MTASFEILSIDPEKKRIGVALVPEGSARAGATTSSRTGIAPGARLTGKVERHEKFGVFVFLASVNGSTTKDQLWHAAPSDMSLAPATQLPDNVGISAAVDSSDFGAVELPDEWRGKADVIVDLLGRPESLGWALDSLDRDGRLVCLTTFRDVEFAVSPRQLVQLQLAVLGSRYNSRYEVGLAGAFVRAGRVRPVVSRRVSLDEVDSVHEELRRGTLLGRGALVW